MEVELIYELMAKTPAERPVDAHAVLSDGDRFEALFGEQGQGRLQDFLGSGILAPPPARRAGELVVLGVCPRSFSHLLCQINN